jgi:hypothetical protein
MAIKKNKTVRDEKLSKMLNIKNSFNRNIKGIKKFVAHVKPVVEEADKSDVDAVLKSIEEAYKQSGLPIQKKDEEHKLTEEEKKTLYKYLKIPELKSPNQGMLLWKGNFVLLMSTFEYLFADIITFYFKHYPQSIIDKTVEVDLSEINSCSSIDEYLDIVISKKVEGILYKSIDKQIDCLEKELKLDLERDLIDWGIIKEATLRRHLIVHNNSVINKRYLCEAKHSKIVDLKNLKEGKKVLIGPKYFNRVYQELFLAGNILIQNAWRKWLSNYEQVANVELIDMTYEGNLEKEFIVSEKIGNYGRRYNIFNNEYKFMINVNYCLALKGQNKKEELEKEIKQIDISNLRPLFVLAYYALLDDKVNALKILRNAKTVDKIKWNQITEWPLFEGLRKDKDFILKAQKIFNPKIQKAISN